MNSIESMFQKERDIYNIQYYKKYTLYYIIYYNL